MLLLENLEQARGQARDVVMLEEVAAATLSHLDPLAGRHCDEALDGVREDLGVAWWDAESRLRIADWVVRRLAEEDDRPPGCEVVGELVEADAEAVQRQVAQPVDECVCLTHHPAHLALGHRGPEVDVVQVLFARALDQRLALLPLPDHQEPDVVAAPLLENGGSVEDAVEGVGGHEAAEEHDPEGLSRSALIGRQLLVAPQLDTMRHPQDLVRRNALGLDVCIRVAPEHDDALGMVEQVALELSHPPRRTAVRAQPAEIDESLRPQVGDLEKESRALGAGNKQAGQGCEWVDRHSDDHLGPFTLQDARDERQHAEHQHVQDAAPVVAAVARGVDPDVEHALDVFFPPEAPAELARRAEVIVAEAADEDGRGVSLLHEPPPDVEAAGGQPVWRVCVVIDDPDPHGAEVYLRVESDSVTSTAPRTRSMRIGLS